MKYSFADAQDACPEGFHLPTVHQFAGLLENCIETTKYIRCDRCQNSSPCKDMFQYTLGWILWTANECNGSSDYRFKYSLNGDEGGETVTIEWNAIASYEGCADASISIRAMCVR